MSGFEDLAHLYVGSLVDGRCLATSGVGGKLRFVSEAAASQALELAKLKRATGAQRRQEQRVYHCQACDGWHLARDPGPPA